MRFNFSLEYHTWQIRHRSPVLFTDESSFTESTNDRRARVWIPHESVTQTVSLWTLTGTMGACHGLGRGVLRCPYRIECVC